MFIKAKLRKCTVAHCETQKLNLKNFEITNTLPGSISAFPQRFFACEIPAALLPIIFAKTTNFKTPCICVPSAFNKGEGGR